MTDTVEQPARTEMPPADFRTAWDQARELLGDDTLQALGIPAGRIKLYSDPVRSQTVPVSIALMVVRELARCGHSPLLLGVLAAGHYLVLSPFVPDNRDARVALMEAARLAAQLLPLSVRTVTAVNSGAPPPADMLETLDAVIAAANLARGRLLYLRRQSKEDYPDPSW